MVQNDLDGAAVSTKQGLELWATTGSRIVRLKSAADSSPYVDNHTSTPTGVSSVYQTGEFSDIGISQHHGAQVRARGSGSMTIAHKSLDNVVSKTLAPITLGLTPGREYWRASTLIGESASLTFSTSGSAGDYFILSGYGYYWSFYASKR